MAAGAQTLGDHIVTGQLIAGSIIPGIVTRATLAQDTGTFRIPLTSWRVWDAVQTNLPATAAADDLAIIGGTFGSAGWTIQTSDAKTTTVTQRAIAVHDLPAEYVSGAAITIRAHAGMNTTVANGTATVDFEVYKSDDEGGVGSDICATAAQTINSLTDADKDFTITPTGLAAGDTLIIRMTVAVTDSGTGTAVIGQVGSVDVLAGVKG